MSFQLVGYFLNSVFCYGFDQEVSEEVRVGLKNVITQLASDLDETVRAISQVSDIFIFFFYYVYDNCSLVTT